MLGTICGQSLASGSKNYKLLFTPNVFDAFSYAGPQGHLTTVQYLGFLTVLCGFIDRWAALVSVPWGVRITITRTARAMMRRYDSMMSLMKISTAAWAIRRCDSMLSSMKISGAAWWVRSTGHYHLMHLTCTSFRQLFGTNVASSTLFFFTWHLMTCI